MIDFIVIYTPWLLSVVTIIQMILTGNKWKNSWMIGLIIQSFWLLWIVCSKNWGFVPLNICMWIVCFRNHMKWRNE
jgi:hypothetical protein